MRQSEIDYWDGVCRERIVDGAINDNWLKRMVMTSHFAKYNWMHERVLEIGVGAGISAAILKIACGGAWDYTGTDLSTEYAKAADQWKLKVVQADVLSLPVGPFTRVLALDSLEHVRQEDRPQGYDCIVARMEEGAIMFINIPLTQSQHQDEYDHGFGLNDLHELEKRGMSLEKYETYICDYPKIKLRRHYAMAVLSK